MEERLNLSYLKVSDMIHAHQNDSFLLYEIYWEDANVTLYDGGFVMWEPENLVLRGGSQHLCEYADNRILRWDVGNGVIKLCLGRIEEPSKETKESALDFVEMMETKRRSLPRYVKEDQKVILERLRKEEYEKFGFHRMIACANHIAKKKEVEFLTVIGKEGFEYQSGKEVHKVVYQDGFIVDGMVQVKE